MRYALNLATDGRILSATEERYAAPGQPIVNELPEGDIANWLWVDGEYIYDPLPPPETPPQSDAERIAALEEELLAAKILLGLEV